MPLIISTMKKRKFEIFKNEIIKKIILNNDYCNNVYKQFFLRDLKKIEINKIHLFFVQYNTFSPFWA